MKRNSGRRPSVKFTFLTDDERKQARDVRQQGLATELRRLEAEFYERELDYRLANQLTPPDEARKSEARALQAALDARYTVVLADFNAIKG